jgi:hypothetical protein
VHLDELLAARGMTSPAGFGGEVDPRVQGDAEADGGVFASCDVGEAVHEVG